MTYDLAVIGGGAAGFFGAIQTAEKFPEAKIIILEKSNKLLSKVKISGGGRCNVTHACFDPKEMIGNYPRGQKELQGPFHQFLCGDMMEWLSNKGVETKIEEDGRVFPASNSSQSIIDCFLQECKKNSIQIKLNQGLTDFKKEGNFIELQSTENNFRSRFALFTTGSSPKMWKLLKSKGISIVPPVPSLFTFNIKHPILKDLMGLSVPNAEVKITRIKNSNGHEFISHGPLLITHWGLSGPAILKLSSWAARELNTLNYNFDIVINWLEIDKQQALDLIHQSRKNEGAKKLRNNNLFQLPKRLWERILHFCKIEMKNFADLNSNEIEQLITALCDCRLPVHGKSTFKEEFVTCGGVELKEVNFKSMESKSIEGLFFAGEVLNIDAITGGFNFQAAWTEGFIAGREIGHRISLQS